jgi:hypothetical protein
MSAINYNNKQFRAISNTPNGLTSEETIFRYQQTGNIVSASYSGGRIKMGHLLGIVDDAGGIDMRYHQIHHSGEIMTGICRSTPERLANGKIRLHENWQWTSGDLSEGHSIVEEV